MLPKRIQENRDFAEGEFALAKKDHPGVKNVNEDLRAFFYVNLRIIF